MSLLEWVPPQAVKSFDEVRVRAPSVSGRISRAIAAALEDTGMSRAEVAEAMSELMGANLSVNMLNAYASQARETHGISAARYAVLAKVTGDARLVELLAQPLGLAAVDRRYLLHIELAAVTEQERELRRRGETLRRMSRFRGPRV